MHSIYCVLLCVTTMPCFTKNETLRNIFKKEEKNMNVLHGNLKHLMFAVSQGFTFTLFLSTM